MSLKIQAIAGIKWTTAASIINSLLQIVQLAILARLLDPTDFGLMALVMVVIGFSQMFIDMGVSNALIYKQKITIEQLSSLYWLNIIIGLLLFILLIVVSPFVSNIYENQKLTSVINLVAITFLIKPWGQQFMVLLQKNMQFNAIAKTDIASRFISFIFVIVLAYKNFGVYSIAIGTVIFAIFSTIGYNFYGRNLYKPKLFLNIKLLKSFLGFGLFQMGEKIINYFSTQFDTILIGKLLGIETLGIYNVAKSIVSKPSAIINPVVTKVTFPLMSKFNNDISQLKSVFLKTMNYLSFANFPVYFLLVILARPIVLIMFGEEWESAIPIVQILSLTFLLRAIGNPSGSLLLSKGKANVAFYWNLILFIFYPLSIYIGSYWGIIGITWSLVILHFIILYPNWRFIVHETCKAGIIEYSETLKYPIIISGISILVSILTLSLVDEYILKLIFGVLLFSFVFLFLLFKIQPIAFYEIRSLIIGSSSMKKLVNK
jgi:O-antigen/teichoic acid export membrane protein